MLQRVLVAATVAVWVVAAFLWVARQAADRRYPDPATLAHEDGMILHPTLGPYPEQVPYEDGMALMPGQSTVVGIYHPTNLRRDAVDVDHAAFSVDVAGAGSDRRKR